MLSASSWTAAKLVKGCGATGSLGPIGPIGPPGPPGTPGISTGLVLYFGLLGNIQAGASQATEPITTSPPTTGTSANAIYSQYTGYFNEVWAPTNASTVATPIGTFTTGNILPSSISAGVWNFNVSTYCGNPNSASSTVGWTPVSGTVYAVITILGDGTHATIVTNDASFPTNAIDFTQFTASIPNNIIISNKATAYLSIGFFAKTNVNPTSNSVVFQFWSNGDSISDVITTLPTQSGPTGPTGSSGPTGSTGPQGIPGAAGAPGSTISGVPNQVSFFGGNGGLTGTSNLRFLDVGGLLIQPGSNPLFLLKIIPLAIFVQDARGNAPVLSYTGSGNTVVLNVGVVGANNIWMAPFTTLTINGNIAPTTFTISNPSNYWNRIGFPQGLGSSTNSGDTFYTIQSYSLYFT